MNQRHDTSALWVALLGDWLRPRRLTSILQHHALVWLHCLQFKDHAMPKDSYTRSCNKYIWVSLGPSCGLWYFGNLRSQINRVRPAGIDWLGWICTLTWRFLEISAIGNWAIDDVNNTVNTSWWKNYAYLSAETFFLPIKCWSWPCSFLTSAGRCAFSQRVVRFGSHLYLYNAVYLSISFVIFLRVSLEASRVSDSNRQGRTSLSSYSERVKDLLTLLSLVF